MPPLQGKFILRFVVYWNFTRILYGAVQCKRLVVYINHLPETIIKDFRQPVTYLIPSILISAAMMALYVAIYQCWIEERYPRRKAAAWALFFSYGLVLMQTIRYCVLTGFLCSCMVGLSQFITQHGYCQLDDAVTNTTGMFVGWPMLRALERGVDEIEHVNIPVGTSDFAEVRQKDFYYVDKTGLIEELMRTPSTKVTLITRPRRFGKTLGMSMMAEFFDIRKNSGSLFRGAVCF